MSSDLHARLQALAAPETRTLLRNINRGVEKESLRITPEGQLAQTPHPPGLGAPLTHGFITTDYSEALLEFITPVSTDVGECLRTLEDIHSYTYSKLGDELLWAASMPCIVTGDDGIPVAHYGSSNVARMKTVYRLGLGHRYGRLMQAIAGVHYNFSMPDAWWEHDWQASGQPGSLTDHVSERYLGLIRNFRRHSWLLVYLFGASPAVCASFLRGRTDHPLQAFDSRGRSLYLPHATSLRMGDLGYNSAAQKSLNICYNSLDNYLSTLREAILTPYPAYADIPCGQRGDYQQLNTGLLQIENEFYSPIRPKRVSRSGETPLAALQRGGIEYVEVRCIDVSPFHPAGLDATQIRFLDTFLLYCLLQDSPPCDDRERAEQAANLERVVSRGREPGLALRRARGERALADCAGELLADLRRVAAVLDQAHGDTSHAAALDEQADRIRDPELTPSARILREMREQDLPFFRLAMQYSRRWADYYRGRRLSPAVQEAFERESRRSVEARRLVEAADAISFEEYLDGYFAQYRSL